MTDRKRLTWKESTHCAVALGCKIPIPFDRPDEITPETEQNMLVSADWCEERGYSTIAEDLREALARNKRRIALRRTINDGLAESARRYHEAMLERVERQRQMYQKLRGHFRPQTSKMLRTLEVNEARLNFNVTENGPTKPMPSRILGYHS